jgi:hypothetical protein
MAHDLSRSQSLHYWLTLTHGYLFHSSHPYHYSTLSTSISFSPQCSSTPLIPPQNTAPPIINTLSSSLLTHWIILFALCANAARLVFAGATAYNSNNGVLHASAIDVVFVSWWTLRVVGLLCILEWSLL